VEEILTFWWGMKADNIIWCCVLLLYMNRQYTSIRITKELREILYKIGRKNETYEDIVIRLIKEAGYDVEKL